MVGMMLVIVLCSIIGLMIYAEYDQCDPVGAKVRFKVKKNDKKKLDKKKIFLNF